MARTNSMVWSHARLDLIGTNNNYFVAFKEIPYIEQVPIELTCGETLEPGDQFHMAGRGASASTPGFSLLEGSLEYVGKTPMPEINNDTVSLLFNWIDGNKRQPLADFAKQFDAKVAFVAFTEIGKDWHFTTSACSGRHIITDELRRGAA